MNIIKNRLLRLADNKFLYKFSSNWCYWLEGLDQMVEEAPEYYEEFYREAKDFVENDFNSFKSEFVEIAQENIPTIIDLNFTLKSEDAIMTVTYSEEPTNDILEKTKDWITGQYSDGWGEGLEQQSFSSYEDEDEIEYEDEETGEIYTETEKVEKNIYVKLWPKNFSLNIFKAM